MTLLDEAKALYPGLKALKDDLHRHPELSFQERRTTALLRERLAALGLELVDLGMDVGAVAVLRGGRPGPCVALRADIDAIELQEPDGPCTSERPGVMHACGHDFHAAGLYGAAQLLSARKDGLPGSVVFFFQPAEEVAGGARAMVEHGLWDKLPEKPRYVFGLHNRPEVPTGQIAVIPGPIMAGKSNFTLTLHGKSGHGGSPHKCVDVLVAAAAFIQAVQTVVSRNTDPQEALVCTVCSIHGGSPANFAPDLVTLTGSVRALNDQVRAMAAERLEALARSISEAYACTFQFEIQEVTPLTWNGPEATALARRAAEALVGAENVVQPRPDLGSEDFAVYGQTVPAFFYWLGTGRPGQENPCWHSDRFRTDDQDGLSLAAALLAQSALTALDG